MAKVSAFGAATKKAATKQSGPSGPIFPCGDVKDENGKVIYTTAQMQLHLSQYIDGHGQFKAGESLMEKNRKPLIEFATQRMADYWAKTGRRPEHSPKVVTSETGDGSIMTTIFLDKEKNLTQEQFDDLAAIIGEENATGATTRRFEYSFNAQMLETELPDLPKVEAYDDDGNALFVKEDDVKNEIAIEDGQKPPKGFIPKMRYQTYFDVVDAAFGEKFEALFGDTAGERLGGLMVKKPVFKTNKGMIDDLLDFVGRGKEDSAKKLALAIEKSRVEIQLKPSGGAKKAKSKDQSDNDDDD
jgi:hypothetical protein